LYIPRNTRKKWQILENLIKDSKNAYKNYLKPDRSYNFQYRVQPPFSYAYMWQNYISMSKHRDFFALKFASFCSLFFHNFCQTKKIRIKRTEATTVNAMIMVSGYFGFFWCIMELYDWKCDEIWGYVRFFLQFCWRTTEKI